MKVLQSPNPSVNGLTGWLNFDYLSYYDNA